MFDMERYRAICDNIRAQFDQKDAAREREGEATGAPRRV
jgi:hypothetical protein